MKRHITPGQLFELSEEGRKRLQDWWKPKDGDKCFHLNEESFLTGNTRKDSRGYRTHDALDGHFIPAPLLSIGQMLEFLVGTTISKKSLFIGYLLEENCVNTERLCDDLWQEVKAVMKADS